MTSGFRVARVCLSTCVVLIVACALLRCEFRSRVTSSSGVGSALVSRQVYGWPVIAAQRTTSGIFDCAGLHFSEPKMEPNYFGAICDVLLGAALCVCTWRWLSRWHRTAQFKLSSMLLLVGAIAAVLAVLPLEDPAYRRLLENSVPPETICHGLRIERWYVQASIWLGFVFLFMQLLSGVFYIARGVVRRLGGADEGGVTRTWKTGTFYFSRLTRQSQRPNETTATAIPGARAARMAWPFSANRNPVQRTATSAVSLIRCGKPNCKPMRESLPLWRCRSWRSALRPIGRFGFSVGRRGRGRLRLSWTPCWSRSHEPAPPASMLGFRRHPAGDQGRRGPSCMFCSRGKTSLQALSPEGKP